MSSITSKTIITALTFGISLLPITAAAQSSDFNQSQYQHGSEARLSLAIPFGTERKDYKSKPRLALSVRQYSQSPKFDNGWATKPLAQNTYFENEIALSLSKAPEFTLNGQSLKFETDGNTNLSGGEKIALGVVAVGVVVLVSGLVIADGWEKDFE